MRPRRCVPKSVCVSVVFFIFGTGKTNFPGGVGGGKGDKFQMFEMKI